MTIIRMMNPRGMAMVWPCGMAMVWPYGRAMVWPRSQDLMAQIRDDKNPGGIDMALAWP